MLITSLALAAFVLVFMALGVFTYRAMQRLDPLNDEAEVEADRKFRHEHGTMAEQTWP